MTHVLQRCQLIDSKPVVEDGLEGQLTISSNGVSFTAEHDDYLTQDDLNSCGPIACAKVLEELGLLRGHSDFKKLREEVSL